MTNGILRWEEPHRHRHDLPGKPCTCHREGALHVTTTCQPVRITLSVNTTLEATIARHRRQQLGVIDLDVARQTRRNA